MSEIPVDIYSILPYTWVKIVVVECARAEKFRRTAHINQQPLYKMRSALHKAADVVQNLHGDHFERRRSYDKVSDSYQWNTLHCGKAGVSPLDKVRRMQGFL
jgi:hypothetical protein